MKSFSVTEISNFFREKNTSDVFFHEEITCGFNPDNCFEDDTLYKIHTTNNICDFKLASSIASSNTDRRQKAQLRLGVLKEKLMMDEYEKITKRKIENRNLSNMELAVSFESCKIKIVGRMDGMNWERCLVVEHKSRTRKLLEYVPEHEMIQCHIYMKMVDFKKCDLIESFGNHMMIHRIHFDPNVWERILQCLKEKISNS